MPRKFDKHMRPLKSVSKETMDRLEEERESRSAKKRIDKAKKNLVGQGFVLDKFKGFAKSFK